MFLSDGQGCTKTFHYFQSGRYIDVLQLGIADSISNHVVISIINIGKINCRCGLGKDKSPHTNFFTFNGHVKNREVLLGPYTKYDSHF